MSSDASAAAFSPMTNGASPGGSHREADASTAENPASSPTLADVCADLHQRVTNFLHAEPRDEVTKRTQEQTRISMQVIEKALQDYDFNALSLSYNGGKDCLVLLILYLAVLHTHFTSPTGRRKDEAFPTTIPSIYAKPPDPFPQVTAFVNSSTQDYHLDLTHISTNPGDYPNPSKAKSHSSPPASPEKVYTKPLASRAAAAGATTSEQATQVSSDLNSTPSITQPHSTSPAAAPTLPSNISQAQNRIVTFRDAFALYLGAHPSVRAIFVGTRRTDPHGAHLTHFDMTDGKWPRFMRIHPVIDWHLSQIWTFLRSPYLADRRKGQDVLEYCKMYDEGYTSLGGVNDTLRNPRLRVVDGETGRDSWRPAYCLVEDDEERLGRE